MPFELQFSLHKCPKPSWQGFRPPKPSKCPFEHGQFFSKISAPNHLGKGRDPPPHLGNAQIDPASFYLGLPLGCQCQWLFHAKDKGMVEKRRIGAVPSMAWADAKNTITHPCGKLLTFHSKANGMVEKGRIGAVLSMAWAVAKQFAAVSLSPSIDSITRPRLYQDTWSVGSSLRIFDQTETMKVQEFETLWQP